MHIPTANGVQNSIDKIVFYTCAGYFLAYAGIFLCYFAQKVCIFIEKLVKYDIITVDIAGKLSNVVKKQKYSSRNPMYNAIVLKIAKRKGAAGL